MHWISLFGFNGTSTQILSYRAKYMYYIITFIALQDTQNGASSFVNTYEFVIITINIYK